MISIDAVENRLDRCSQWARSWTPAFLLRWCRRHRFLSALLGGGLVVLLVGAASAWASPGTGTELVDDEGDVLTSWMGIKDTDGVPIAKYALTLNQGGWNDPVSKTFAAIDSVVYGGYRGVTAGALWLIKFGLDFEWLKLFTGPFQTIGKGVDSAMTRFGLAPTALAVLALIVVCTTLTGKTAKAMSNLAMGMLMIGVAATIFAHPLAQLVGPSGLLAKGRDNGLQIATTLSGGSIAKRGTGADTRQLQAHLADRFLRNPTQMINFGKVADSVSLECRKAWSEGIKKDRGDKLKDDIAGCDSVKGKAMKTKSMGSPSAALIPLIICGMLAAFLVAFACYFVWHVVRTAVQAMVYATLATPAFTIGMIPGGAQTFAWKTVLDCLMAYVAMIVYTGAFGGYNAILDKVFEGNNAIEALFLTAFVLALGFAFLGPLRRIFDRGRDNIAAKFSNGTVSHSAGGRGGLSDRLRARQKANDGKGSPVRRPSRIDSESESAKASTAGGGPSKGGPGGGGPGGGGPGGDGGGESSLYFGPIGGHTPTSGGGTAEEAPAPAETPRRPRRADPVPAAASDADREASGDRLAAAVRIYRASRGATSGSGRANSPRHALSEAA